MVRTLPRLRIEQLYLLVSFGLPTLAFLIDMGALGMLVVHEISFSGYLNFAQITIIVIGLGFIPLCLTNFGAGMVRWLIRSEWHMWCLPYVMLLAIAVLAMPKLLTLVHIAKLL